MRPKVSIIVPIYNMEMYLSRCLESLLAQTLYNIEIIVINDGSNDLSIKILREFELKDARIKVIDRPNDGVSSARNEGIRIATGEYIGFVDPDDWINPIMYEEMYNNAITENTDIVMCSYIREFGSHSKIKDFNLPNKVRYINEDVKINIMRRLIGPINHEIANPEFLDAWGTVWSKLYRTNLIVENNIKFLDLEKIGTNEDTLFNIEASYYAKSFLFINSPFYHYWRANSTSVTSRFKPKLINQWMYLFGYIEDFLKDKNMNNDYYLALNNRICLNTLGLGLNTITKDNDSSGFEKIRRIRMFLKEKRIKHSFKEFDLSQLPIIWRVFYFCAKNRFATGFYFMLICIEFLRKVIR
ncbi:glycosyltransferase [Neobacillus drentensis]|uniref:glycosyltransferase n=1 Tax=Neobacillus drentensis TaxID=220684 RepID=UPI002FFE9A33